MSSTDLFGLAVKYLKGEGEKQDHEKAVRLFRKVARLNAYPALEAQFCLAGIYESGEGAPQNDSEALKWYLRSAKGGHAEAQFYLAYKYRVGQGVEQDHTEALKWFRKAARKNNDHAVAQYFLGEMFYSGEGVQQDHKEALKWYKKAAEKGDEYAQYSLGYMYENGEGVSKSDAESLKWYQLAAEQGHSGAQSCLGTKYYFGQGVPHAGSMWAMAEAEKWLGKAADQGNKDAREILEALRGGDIYRYFSELLQPKETQEYLVDSVSRFVLNYYNNIHDICYGLALGQLEDDAAPFNVGVLGTSYDDLSEKIEYFQEEQEADWGSIVEALQNALSDVLTVRWPSVIEKRLAIERQFQNTEEFVAFRRFLILLESVGVNFYTKASDGGGPDIIEGTVTTDLIHSSCEDKGTINKYYSAAALKQAMEGFEGDDLYGFATLNLHFTDKGAIEFFGPAYDHPFHKFIEKNNRKESFLAALVEVAKQLSLPMNAELKFKPGEDRIVFNIIWERKVPEFFHDIANHTIDNRF